jgi:hypothetical protein
MYDQPGPIIVRPVRNQSPAPALPRKLGLNAKHMPVGVSANTIDVAGNARLLRLRRTLFLGVPVAVLLAVVFSVWFIAYTMSPLGQKVISNDRYDYHFAFYKSAEPVNLQLGEGLKLDNRAIVIARPTTDNAITDCRGVGKDWRQAFIVSIEGHRQIVCSLDNKAFLAIFYHGQERHLFEITYSSAQKGEQPEIQEIFSSLKVTEQ